MLLHYCYCQCYLLVHYCCPTAATTIATCWYATAAPLLLLPVLPAGTLLLPHCCYCQSDLLVRYCRPTAATASATCWYATAAPLLLLSMLYAGTTPIADASALPM